jgi:flagellar basal-body rod protein FlgB
MVINESWFLQLHRAMDVLAAQHKVIAGNIANVNTPAYTRMKLDFAQELNRLENEETGGENSATEFMPTQDIAGSARPDGNNVSLEKEMVDLSQTNEVYGTLSTLAQKQIILARYVISGGR